MRGLQPPRHGTQVVSTTAGKGHELPSSEAQDFVLYTIRKQVLVGRPSNETSVQANIFLKWVFSHTRHCGTQWAGLLHRAAVLTSHIPHISQESLEHIFSSLAFPFYLIFVLNF